MNDFKSDNLIIAEFMMGKPSPSPNWEWDYHKSWDSLMPVIEKIIKEQESIFYITAPNFIPGQNNHTLSMLSYTDHHVIKRGNNFFEMAYQSVVEYLKNKKN